MSDLTDKQAATTIKLTGADPVTGVESNFVDVDSNGHLKTDQSSWLGSTAPTVGQKAMAASIPVVISSDQSPITINAGGNRNDVVNNKIFSIAVDILVPSSGVDNPLILIRNPTGSGRTMYIGTITGGVAAAKFDVLKLYGSPTVTAVGTTLTPRNRNVGSASASNMLITTTPTVTVLGNYLDNAVIGPSQNSAEISANYTIALQPNTSMLITGRPDSNNVTASISVVWFEE